MMRIRIRLLPPFGDGKTWHEVHVPDGSRVRDLLNILPDKQPVLLPYRRATPEETLHQFILLREDHVLSPDETLEPEDRIVLVMPLTGG
jgi:sulfur carrier protein ThiS